MGKRKKIIGVYFNEITPILQNELLSYLKSKKYAVIDISTNLEEIAHVLSKERIDIKDSIQMQLFEVERAEEKAQKTEVKTKKLITGRIISFVKRLFP